MRHPLRGRDRRARARAARDPRRGGCSVSAVAVAGEAREVVLAEAQAVVAAGGSAHELVAEIDEGSVVEEVETLERILELGLQTGRIRALYGPGGEQAALRLYRKLPQGTEVAETVAAVNDALRALAGRELESVQLRAVGPGSFALTIQTGGAEVGVHLDRQGARLSSVGV